MDVDPFSSIYREAMWTSRRCMRISSERFGSNFRLTLPFRIAVTATGSTSVTDRWKCSDCNWIKEDSLNNEKTGRSGKPGAFLTSRKNYMCYAKKQLGSRGVVPFEWVFLLGTVSPAPIQRFESCPAMRAKEIGAYTSLCFCVLTKQVQLYQ